MEIFLFTLKNKIFSIDTIEKCGLTINRQQVIALTNGVLAHLCTYVPYQTSRVNAEVQL